jgi:hypothetical protein
VNGDGCDDCKVVCPMGEVEDPITHHCYLFSRPSTNWGAAKAACEAIPGYYLAALTTLAEINFLKDIPKLDMWIGAQKVNGAWTWVSQEPWTYVDKVPPWRLNEPTGGADCVEIGSTAEDNDAGTLNDSDCPKLKPYLCEWNPPGAL